MLIYVNFTTLIISRYPIKISVNLQWTFVFMQLDARDGQTAAAALSFFFENWGGPYLLSNDFRNCVNRLRTGGTHTKYQKEQMYDWGDQKLMDRDDDDDE
jgi:hypothetical protein